MAIGGQAGERSGGFRGGRLPALLESHFQPLALGISVLCGVLLAVLIRNGWFAEDDFLNLAEARESGLTIGFLLDPIQGTRFSPGHRFGDWLVLQFPGNEWLAVIVISGACLAIGCFFAALLTKQTTGSATAGLVIALIFGTWVGWVRIGSWWATSAHTLPMMASGLGAVYAAIMWDSKNRRTSLLVISVVLTVAALAFSVRAALVPLIIAVVLILGLPSDRPLSTIELRERIRECWPPVALGLLSTLVFLIIEFRQQTSSAAIRAAPPEEWAAFIAKWMLEGLPSILTNSLSLVFPEDTGMIAVGLVIAGALVTTTARGARSASLWAATLVLLLLAAVQVGVARLGAVEPGIANDSRYHEGDILILAVLVPVIWAAARKPLPRSPGQRTAAGAFLVLFGACWAINGAVSARDLRSGPGFNYANPGVIPKATYETLRTTLPEAVGRSAAPTLLNTSIPTGFAPIQAERESGAVWILVGGDVTGRIVSAFFPEYEFSRWQSRGTPILIDDAGRALRLTGTSTIQLPTPEPRCLSTSPTSKWLGKGSAGFSIPLERAKPSVTDVLELEFERPASSGPIALAFDTEQAKEVPDLEVRVTPTRTGLRAPIPPSASSVGVGAWGGLEACLKEASITTTAGRRNAQ